MYLLEIGMIKVYEILNDEIWVSVNLEYPCEMDGFQQVLIISAEWSSDDGWTIGPEFDQYNLTDDQRDQFWNMLHELPVPKVVFND